MTAQCLGCRIVLPHPATKRRLVGCRALQSPLHGPAMLSPLCTRGAGWPRCRSSLRSRVGTGPVPGLPFLSLPEQIQPATSQDCNPAPSGKAGAPRPRAHTAGESMGVAARHQRHAGSRVGTAILSLPRQTQPASVRLPSAAAQYDSGVTPPKRHFQNTACRWDPPPPLAAPSCKPAAPPADTKAPGCKGCWPEHRPAPK